MLVLAIIAMLMGVGIWKLAGVTDKGRETRVKGDIQVIMMALRKYEGDAGSFPNTAQGLQALVEDPGNIRNWSPALDEPLYDPWNNEYGYRFPGKFSKTGKPDIFSRGPDGEEGTEDDIGNWDRNR
jgi:general secretion pathway protein G